MKILKALIVLAPVVAISFPASATCVAKIANLDNVRIGAGGGYDPYDVRDYAEQAAVEVRLIEGENCRLQIAMASAGTVSERIMQGPSGKGIEYHLYRGDSRAGGKIANTGGAASFNGLPVLLRHSGDLMRVAFLVTVPPGQVRRPGDYSDVVEASLLDATGGAGALLDKKSFSISSTVVSRAGINLSGTGGDYQSGSRAYTMDFGDLRAGATQTIYVQVRSSADYEILMRSENGALVHGADGGRWRVDYSASLNGRPLSLRENIEIAALRSRGPTTIRGDSYPLSIRIGEVARRRAGDYQDIVHLKVLPLE